VIVSRHRCARAMQAMAAGMGSSCEFRAAHLARDVAARVGTMSRSARRHGASLEGVEPRSPIAPMRLMNVCGPSAALTRWRAQSRALWEGIRDVVPFGAAGRPGNRIVWRLSVAPTKGAAAARGSRKRGDAECFLRLAASVWEALRRMTCGGGAVHGRSLLPEDMRPYPRAARRLRCVRSGIRGALRRTAA